MMISPRKMSLCRFRYVPGQCCRSFS